MACVTDGRPSRSAREIMDVVAAGARTAEEVANRTGLPLYRVRGGLRELAEAGFVRQTPDGFLIS